MGRGPGVRAASASSIQIDFRYKGQRCRERISLPPTEANKRYVKRLKATIEHEIELGTFDYARHFPESKRAKLRSDANALGAALSSYCDSLAGQLEPETIEEYRLDAATVAKGLGKDATLEGLTRAHVRSWLSTLTLSKKRIDNLLIPLRGALNQAVEDGKIKANPIAGLKVKRATRPKEVIDPFTPAEVEKLRGAVQTGALWGFWAWTGLRTGEIIAAEWADVDPECRTLNVWRAVRLGREKGTKTSSGTRRLNLLQPARDTLLRLRREEGAIFQNPISGKPYVSDKQVRVAFRKACEAVGVRYRYPYQLRHTFATWALSSGENPKWIASQLGHADVMMLFRTYGKWMASLAPDAGSKMISAIDCKAA